jgi:mono/diheme cytochrome c family protein
MNIATTMSFVAAIGLTTAVPLVAQGTPDNATPQKPPTTDTAAAAPAGAVTPELIAQGEKIYSGPGNCYACHGSKGEGSVGPNLTDSEWLHSKGSLEEIVAQVTQGVPKEKSKSGIPMPPKGGGTLSEDDIKAVAAYVYSLGHK